MARSVRVFISYRHQEPDRALAHTFAGALEKAGHEVFIDSGIRWGTDWVKRIREALERTDFLLLLLSREAANSEMVVEEVLTAKELAQQHNGVPIILPLRVRFPFTEPLPYNLSASLRSIQQERWNGDEDTAPLVRQLLDILADGNGWTTEIQETPQTGSIRQEAPQPQVDPRNLIIPGGALDVDSRFYVKRQADEDVLNTVSRSRAMVTVRGPRQTGKTSLIMRAFASMRQSSPALRATFFDFQALRDHDLQSLDTIWCAIANHLADQLWLDDWDEECWKEKASYDRNFTRFLDHFVFADTDAPLLICLDEVDRIFNAPIKSEYFASVRAFYNRGAFDPAWKKVRWLLATSSEPSFFIEDLTQSPFNIGLRVNVGAFTPKEVENLTIHHGLTLDRPTLNRIVDYTGGRPYLVHVIAYHLARNPGSRDQLFNAETAGGGVFREHLHRYLLQFQKEEALFKAMQRITDGQGCEDVRIAGRLEAAGLVRRNADLKVVPLGRLYADFFSKELR